MEEMEEMECLVLVDHKDKEETKGPLDQGMVQAHRQGGGGSRASLEPPFWPPKEFIYTAIVHFKCPTGPLVVSLLLRITAVQASLVAALRVCS